MVPTSAFLSPALRRGVFTVSLIQHCTGIVDATSQFSSGNTGTPRPSQLWLALIGGDSSSFPALIGSDWRGLLVLPSSDWRWCWFLGWGLPLKSISLRGELSATALASRLTTGRGGLVVWVWWVLQGCGCRRFLLRAGGGGEGCLVSVRTLPLDTGREGLSLERATAFCCLWTSGLSLMTACACLAMRSSNIFFLWCVCPWWPLWEVMVCKWVSTRKPQVTLRF